MTTPPLSRPTLGLLAIGALALALATHALTLRFALQPGDYALLRPFTQGESLAVLSGPWAAADSGLGAYYRPAAAILFGGLFEILGVHARWLHALALLEVAAVIWFAALFAAREGGVRAGIVTGLLFAVHPLLPGAASVSAGALATLTSLALAGLALLRWQRARTDLRLLAWWPIFALIGIGTFVREDLIVLAPALLLLQWWRARNIGDVRPPNVAVVAGAVATLVGVGAIRAAAFPHLPLLANGAPALLSQLVAALTGAAHAVAARAAASPLSVVASVVAVIGTALMLGAVLWAAAAVARTPSAPATPIAHTGAVLVLAFTLPLLIDPSRTEARLPFLVFAAALLAGAGIITLLERLPAFPAAFALVVVATPLAWSQHVQMRDYLAPCHGGNTVTLLPTPPVAGEARASACTSGLEAPLDEQMPVMQWSAGPRRVIWLARDAQSVTFSLTPPASLTGDVEIHVDVDGASHTAVLHPDARTRLTYRLRSSFLQRARGGHWIDLRTDTDMDLPLATDVSVVWSNGR